MKKILSIIMASLASLQVSASDLADLNKQLAGVWILEKSENPMPNGAMVSYCTGVHGMIIYTSEGYVSVALNCAEKGNGEEPADVSGRKFFYAGKFAFDGSKVTYNIQNASDFDLIGTSIKRTVSISGNELILSGENHGQSFSAYWKKVE
jgi:hypothetical protein